MSAPAKDSPNLNGGDGEDILSNIQLDDVEADETGARDNEVEAQDNEVEARDDDLAALARVARVVDRFVQSI